MAETSIALSPTTRVDTFTDYIRLQAYKANTLFERANVATGRGTNLIKSWFIPMPQTIGRMVAHNYQVVEQSVAYALAKGEAQGRQSQIDAANVSLASAGLMSSLGSSIPGVGGDMAQAIGGIGYLSGVAASIAGAVSMIPAMEDFMEGLKSEMVGETPVVGMSTQELKYGGTVERSYVLDYEFVAKEPADVYGPNGILQILADLEAWSFPRSRDNEVSRRDLILTPPVFVMQHVKLNGEGGIASINNSPPLAALGQPKLLILRKVESSHEMKSVLVNGNYTYPIITRLRLELADMEPLAVIENQYVSYGNITVPRLACRSEIYAEASSGNVSGN